MAAANPRAVAARVLQRVITGQRSLADVLEPALQRLPADRRPLAQELVFGALRWYGRLDAVAARLLARPMRDKDGDVRALLLIGLYQCLEMRVPDHAAVSETVAAVGDLGKGWARGLLNAVLRRFLRERDQLLEAVDAEDAARLAHPPWLLDALRRDWPDDWEAIAAGNNARAPMTLRVNRRLTDPDTYIEALAEMGVRGRRHAIAPDAVVLEQPLPVERLPGFAEGRVSVQDAAAQIAACLLDAGPGQRVLDLCAAPGGKTAHILERCPEVATLTAVDVDADRLERVSENLRRLKLRADVLAGDAAQPSEWWDGRPYDRILLDAPCSASGVIRRHPDIKMLRRAEDIATLAATQGAVLQAAWELLVPGGRLVYATCSVLRDENAGVIAAFLERNADARIEPLALPCGRESGAGRQILPGEQDMDGFYYASVAKR